MLFEGLMNRIEDETALTLIRMPAPEEQAEYELAEPEMSDIEFKHPDAEQMTDSGSVEKDGMIYHGKDEPVEVTKYSHYQRL